MIYAGTGHRPEKIRIGTLDAYDPRVYRRLVDLCVAALGKYQPSKVLSGMAEGFDQALADAAIEVGIPFDALIPHEGQERLWSPQAKKHYRGLLSRAAEVILVSEGPYQAYKMQKRNIALVDRSERLFSLHDGTPGGTFNCLQYAEERDRQVVPLWPHWERYAFRGLLGNSRDAQPRRR